MKRRIATRDRGLHSHILTEYLASYGPAGRSQLHAQLASAAAEQEMDSPWDAENRNRLKVPATGTLDPGVAAALQGGGASQHPGLRDRGRCSREWLSSSGAAEHHN